MILSNLKSKTQGIFGLLFLHFAILHATHAQEADNQQGVLYIAPEILVGKLVANYPDFPYSKIRKSFSLNIGRSHLSANKHWTSYYGFPTTGVGISFSDYANNDVLGKEISLAPYLLINLSKKKLRSWYLKFGLGASYFTRHFDPETNPTNKVIGSDFAWTFQLFMYRSLFATDQVHMKIGAGFWHSSNGHTTLPNFGFNSTMISLVTQFYTKPVSKEIYRQERLTIDKTKHYYLDFRSDLGVHELGGASGPIGGPKKNVYTLAIGVSLLIKQHLKINTGFAYRYYQHYFEQIKTGRFDGFSDRPGWNAANINFFLGVEFLMGHVGMEVAGGLNLHKPFFETHYREFAVSEGDTEYQLKQLFSTRMGLNLYLFNTNNLPKNNVFLGAHINANFGQADFTAVSLGYVKMIK